MPGFRFRVDRGKESRTFIFISIFLAPEEGLSSNRNIGQFVYFFIALPQGSVCRFIFFYKFNCTDPGLQLGDPAPLIGLLLWFC